MSLRVALRAMEEVCDEIAPRTSSPSLERYSRDPWAHCDDGHVTILGIGFDAETGEQILTPVVFRPYAHQREAVAAWIDLERLARTGEPRFWNVIEEKSRAMGMTWGLAWCGLWLTSYHEAPGLIQHLDFTEVDDGGSGSTIDSWFGRMRYMHENLDGRYRAPIDFKLGQVKHRFRSGAIVTAEGAGPNPGRGGQFAWAILDEAARIPFDEQGHAALSRAVRRGRFYNSTPHGEDNTYFRLRRDRPQGYRILRHHWTQHPVYGKGAHVAALAPRRAEDGSVIPGRLAPQDSPEMLAVAEACAVCKATVVGVRWEPTAPKSHRYPGKVTSPWYEETIVELTDDQVAMELDIDYHGSLTARVYPEFSEDRHVVEHIAYDGDLESFELWWDYGVDTTAVVVVQVSAAEVRVIGEVEVHDNAYPDTVVPIVMETLANLGIPLRLLSKELIVQQRMIGDPAGEGREQATGRTVVGEYQRHGFLIQSQRQSIQRTIISTKRLMMGLPKRLLVSRRTAPLFVEHAKNNRWPTDRQGKRKMDATEPLNDRHNHMLRAFAYGVTYHWPAPESADAAAGSVRFPAERERLHSGVHTGGVDPATGTTGIGYGTRL